MTKNTATGRQRAALHIGDEALRSMPNVFGQLDPSRLRRNGEGAKAELPPAGMRLMDVELNAIVEPSPVETRAPFNPEHDEEDAALLRSIELHGQEVPILLDELEGEDPLRYRLKGGHRRVAALQRLGQPRALAVIAKQNSLQSDLLALTDNVRKNLSPLELGRAIQRLRERHGLATKDIVEQTGLTRQHLHLVEQLMGLGPELQAAVERGRLSAKAAGALGKAPREMQASLAQLAAQHDFSEREARDLLGRLAAGESLTHAAQALGLPTGQEPVTEGPPRPEDDARVEASRNESHGNHTGTRRRAALGRRPTQALDARTAVAWLEAHFHEMPTDARNAIGVTAAQHQAGLPAVKLAALLVTGGMKPEAGVETAVLVQDEACARKVLAVLEAELELAALVKRGQFIGTLTPTLTVLAQRLVALSAARDRA